jgi:tetratricopeptide (TPR) repeat protein
LALSAGDKALAPVIVARCELATGSADELARELEGKAAAAEDPLARRDALERLAELDVARGNDEAALRWHGEILNEHPKHKPSLRAIEHALVSGGGGEDLEPIAERIALALDGDRGGEMTAHAQLAARMRMRRSVAEGGGWERTRDMVRLAATQPSPSLWALRAMNAHARHQKEEEVVLETTLVLEGRTQRPAERAALLLRASEAAALLGRVDEARTHLEQAASEDPGDVVTWGFLAELRQRSGEPAAAAEACESLARTSVVPAHQLLAWCDAAKLWRDEVKDPERAMAALEAAAEIDVGHGEVFAQLSAMYAERGLEAELARLLEKRLEKVEDAGERVALQVELAGAFADLGELRKAKAALEDALTQRPDHTTALHALANVCTKEGDWQGAEQAYVKLARFLTSPDEQREVYEKLAELYSVHLNNVSRAEVALKAVLERRPSDVATLTKLVDLYKRQGDIPRAVEAHQRLVAESSDPDSRLRRLIELASIHEVAGRDPRKAEQVLDSARKEFPTSVTALRAMAELYIRQRQMPAMQILLDRAAGDARRAFAQGRFVPSLFEVLHAAYDLRGRKDAARVVAATLAAIEGQASDLAGGEANAVDLRLDDLLAPELLSPSLRALLARTGDALDAASPLDLRALRAAPLVPGSPIAATVGAVATVVGLGAMSIFVSPNLGRVAIPLASYPPTLLVGEGLAEVKSERARAFVVMRAMKMILSRSSALVRAPAEDVAALTLALFTVFNPSFAAPGVDPRRIQDLVRRLGPALPRNLDPSVGVIALEAAGILGTQAPAISHAAHAWASRTALLAIGDPNAALDGLAWARGETAAPTGSEERAAWVARTPEARELMAFSVSEQYAEARARLGLER